MSSLDQHIRRLGAAALALAVTCVPGRGFAAEAGAGPSASERGEWRLMAQAVPTEAGQTAATTTAPPPADRSRFNVTPLGIWAFDVEGDVRVRGTRRPVDVSFRDLMDKLDGGIGLGFSAQKRALSLFTNLSYLKFMEERTPASGGPTAEAALEWLTAESGGAYRLAVVPMGATTLDVEALGGARYTRLDGEIDVPGILNVSDDLDWLDPFVDSDGDDPDRHQIDPCG